MKDVIIATTNPGKVREFQDAFSDIGIRILGMRKLNPLTVEEVSAARGARRRPREGRHGYCSHLNRENFLWPSQTRK